MYLLMQKKKLNLFFLDRFYFKLILMSNFNKPILGKNKIIYKKNNFIFKKLLNSNFFIFKGNNFRSLKINFFSLNYRFGIFTLTRKPFKFINKSKSDEKNLKR